MKKKNEKKEWVKKKLMGTHGDHDRRAQIGLQDFFWGGGSFFGFNWERFERGGRHLVVFRSPCDRKDNRGEETRETLLLCGKIWVLGSDRNPVFTDFVERRNHR
jgi:hypothetical protein